MEKLIKAYKENEFAKLYERLKNENKEASFYAFIELKDFLALFSKLYLSTEEASELIYALMSKDELKELLELND